MIEYCDDLEDLTDDELRKFFDNEAEESPSPVSSSDLANMVQNCIKMDMSVKSAKWRMKLLIMGYKSLLATKGLKWVPNKSQKAVKHVLSVISPGRLQQRLEQDVSFWHAYLKSNFQCFMQHALRVSAAFEMVNCGPQKSRKSENKINQTEKDKSFGTPSTKDESKNATQTCYQEGETGAFSVPTAKVCRQKQSPPDFGLPKLYRRGQKEMEEQEATQARNCPYKFPRSKTSDSIQPSKSVKRLVKGTDTPTVYIDSPFCWIPVSDYKTSFNLLGRCKDDCDDGSSKNITSSKMAEQADNKGIGKSKAIDEVSLEAALRKGGDSAKHTFSRAWKVPCTVL